MVSLSKCFEAQLELLAEWRSHFPRVSCDHHEVVIHIFCLVCVKLCACCHLILAPKWSPACTKERRRRRRRRRSNPVSWWIRYNCNGSPYEGATFWDQYAATPITWIRMGNAFVAQVYSSPHLTTTPLKLVPIYTTFRPVFNREMWLQNLGSRHSDPSFCHLYWKQQTLGLEAWEQSRLVLW